MSDTYFTELEKLCNGLGISLSAQEAAVYTTRLNINTEELEKMIGFFGILKKRTGCTRSRNLYSIEQTSKRTSKNIC